MEFQDRIVEHLLLPTEAGGLTWSQYSPFEQGSSLGGGAQYSLRGTEGIAEFLEYTLAASVGTGGELTFDVDWFLEPIELTGSAINVHVEKDPTKPTVSSISDKLAVIKAAFGLSISQLAQVLRVKRPTIYSWFDTQTGPDALRGANKNRLHDLFGLAQTWNQKSSSPPGRHLDSLLELLSAPALDHPSIHAAFQGLVQTVEREKLMVRRTYAERLRQKGYAEVPQSARTSKGRPTGGKR
jgi:hypothetical protein